jgi:fatty-acyl-CoA synthase
MHFARYLQYWERMRGDRIAFSSADQALTWAAFAAQARGLAGAFQALGLEKGDRVGCLLENSLEWCVAFAACILSGAVLVPLNAAFGYLELQEIERDAACRVVITTRGLAAKLALDPSGLTDDQPYLFDRRGAETPLPYADAVQGARAYRAPATVETDLMAIAYTSGTTGVPKGVMITHAAAEAMCTALSLGFGWTSDERFLVVAPLAFTGGFICNVAPVLRLGACAIIERGFDGSRALRLIEKERVTYFGGVPALWQRLAEATEFEGTDFASLRNGSTGGAPVPEQLLHTFLGKGVLIRQQYGCTEGCGGITLPDARTARERPSLCGFAMASLDVQVQDDAGRPSPTGQIGEICIRGPALMAGYWNKPDLTAAAFAGSWFRTGDLGAMEADGLRVVDRKKNMVISGGVNIYPAEVERLLGDVPGLLEIVVFGMPSHQWGEELTAIVHADGELDLEQLRLEAKRRLGPMKAPKRFALSPTPLPRTATNKVARQQLRELFTALAGAPADAASS